MSLQNTIDFLQFAPFNSVHSVLDDFDSAVFSHMSAYGISFDFDDKNGMKNLTNEGMNGVLRSIARVLDEGADIEEKNQGGHTPLTRSISYRNQALIKLLLDRGADINEPQGNGTARDPFGGDPILSNGDNVTPLYLAVSLINEDDDDEFGIIRLLLDRGADMEIKETNFGTTPLFTSIDIRRKRIINLLLDRGADLETKNTNGYTPLDLNKDMARPIAEILYKLLREKKESVVLCQEEKTKLNDKISDLDSSIVSMSEQLESCNADGREQNVRIAALNQLVEECKAHLIICKSELGTETSNKRDLSSQIETLTRSMVVLQQIIDDLTPSEME